MENYKVVLKNKLSLHTDSVKKYIQVFKEEWIKISKMKCLLIKFIKS